MWDRCEAPKNRHDRSAHIGLIITVILAFVGYLVTYMNTVASERRQARIALVNGQLEKLYGPLYALTQSSGQAWDQFRTRADKARATGRFFDPNNPPTVEEVRLWRYWMKTVFLPVIEKMEQVVRDNAHLIDADQSPSNNGNIIDFPAELQGLLAHAASFRVVVNHWRTDDDQDANKFRQESENVATARYPKGFDDYVAAKFDDLKTRQKELIASNRRIHILGISF